ncbi:Dabb family protein [Mycetocola sp. 2940]|uniref:Dabb family protein n=1 Tax=Mycetocola sp. 2940 TaxID=3156452 RepID=UPI0033926D8F
MIRHIVCWKLTASDAATKAEHAAEITRLFGELPALIPEIRTLQVGENVLFPEVNWDVVLIADFDDADALERYSVHPDHQRVGKYVGQVREDRVAVDFAF